MADLSRESAEKFKKLLSQGFSFLSWHAFCAASFEEAPPVNVEVSYLAVLRWNVEAQHNTAHKGQETWKEHDVCFMVRTSHI